MHMDPYNANKLLNAYVCGLLFEPHYWYKSYENLLQHSYPTGKHLFHRMMFILLIYVPLHISAILLVIHALDVVFR